MAEIQRQREDWWNDPSMDGDEVALAHRRRHAELLEAKAPRRSNVVYLRRPVGDDDPRPPAA